MPYNFNPFTGSLDKVKSTKFSVSNLLSGQALRIPVNNQMIVYDEFINSGELILDGDLIVDSFDQVDAFNIIRSRVDFPAAIGGVITLEDNATYYIANNVDLQGDRIVSGVNTTIIGSSSENCILSSTGLSSALITSEWSLPMRHIALSATVALDLDAGLNANQALDWYGVNFLNCPTVGTIANYSNFIYFNGAFLNSANLTIDGTIGTVAFNQSLFSGVSGQSTIVVAATATIERRLRAIYSSFITPATGIALEVSPSASIPVQSFILDTANFSGNGIPVDGFSYLDNETLFVNNIGIENSREVSQYYMNNNATATIISLVNTEYKAAGATISGPLTTKFTNTDNRATYTGAISRTFKVVMTFSLLSGNNQLIGAYIAKNGTVIPQSEIYTTTTGSGEILNGTVQALVSLATNDFIEFFVENATAANNITVTDLNVIIE